MFNALKKFSFLAVALLVTTNGCYRDNMPVFAPTAAGIPMSPVITGHVAPIAVTPGMPAPIPGGTCGTWGSDKQTVIYNELPDEQKYLMLDTHGAYIVDPCNGYAAWTFDKVQMRNGAIVPMVPTIPSAQSLTYNTDVRMKLNADIVVFEYRLGYDPQPHAVGHLAITLTTPAPHGSWVRVRSYDAYAFGSKSVGSYDIVVEASDNIDLGVPADEHASDGTSSIAVRMSPGSDPVVLATNVVEHSTLVLASAATQQFSTQ